MPTVDVTVPVQPVSTGVPAGQTSSWMDAATNPSNGAVSNTPLNIPAAAPVTTISGSAAQDHVANVIAPALAADNQKITDQKTTQANAAAVANNTPPKTQQQQDKEAGYVSIYGYDTNGARLNNSTNNQKVAGDASATSDFSKLADMPDTGHVFGYNPNDGSRVEVAILPGMSIQQSLAHYGLNSNAPTAQQSTQQQIQLGGGVKQNSTVPLDGTDEKVLALNNGQYIRVDGAGNMIANITADQYQSAMNSSQAYKQQINQQATNDISEQMKGITNGTMPLSPWQQDQINNIKQEYATLITAQTLANANLEGGTRTLQGLLGMSQYSPGLAMGAIKQVVDDGITKIANLQSKMAADVGKMTLAFQQQNFDNLKTLYDEHQKNVEDAQKAIDTIQERIATAKKDQRDYEEKVREFEQNTADKAAQLEFDKVKEDNTMSYRDKQLAMDKMQLSETTRHNKATELEAEKKRLQDAAGSSFDVGSTPFASTIVNVGNLLTAKMSDTRASAITKSIATMAQQKDWQNLLVNVKNQAKTALPAADQTKLNAHENNVAYLSNMEQLLKEYEAIKPGGTGFLVGTAQGIATKYGQEVTDPRLIELQTQMNDNFVRFRADITGAAFSPEESRGYEALVPSANKNIDLNLAVIQGARAYAQQQVDSTYGRQMGKEGYTNLKGVVDTEQAIQSFGEAHPENQQAILKMQADGLSPAKIAEALGVQL